MRYALLIILLAVLLLKEVRSEEAQNEIIDIMEKETEYQRIYLKFKKIATTIINIHGHFEDSDSLTLRIRLK